MTSHRLGPLTVITVAMALLLAACGADPTATPTPTPLPQAEPTPTLDAAARFEAEWAALIKAAQEEGEVSLSFNTGAGRRYRPVAEFFQGKFGIRTVISVGSGSASANRILAERTNGQFLVDIMYAGITTANTRMLPANVLAPVADFLIHPEVTDESLWFGGKHAYSDPEQKYVFVYAANAGATNLGMHYNTDLVSQADIDALNSVFDFLDPKWKSKIVAYSPSGGGGGSYFQAYVHPEIGTEWIDRFVSPELDVTFTQDILFIVNGVTQGKFHMCVSCGSAGRDIESLGSLGAPVEELDKPFKEGGSITGSSNNILVLTNQPHPNAGKLYLNWWLSKEGATMQHTLAVEEPPVTLREDVTEWGGTRPNARRVAGQSYYDFSGDAQYTSRAAEALEYAAAAYEASRR